MTIGATLGFPEPGDDVGHFRLARRLGVGGMGVVYEALDTQLHRQVALKIIAPHLAQDEAFRARFIREARAQASLDSPHVVQVYSFGESDGRLYIASQLIPDGDLGQMLREHGIPPVRVALHLLAQVADGLVDAHAAGLVHRDIKPANVLLRHRDHVLTAYLGDFGIARQVGAEAAAASADASLTGAGATIGTPTYMAPELHTGGDAGPLCDVYSLGCMLWATLSGAAPYSGGTDFQVVHGHVSGPVPQVEPTGLLAVEINTVLHLALAKDPRRRYPSSMALRDDLRRLARLPDDASAIRPAVEAAGQLDAADASTSVPERRAGSPRRWGPVAAGAAVLVTAAAVLAVVLTRGAGSGGVEPPDAARDAQVVDVLAEAFAVSTGAGDEAGRCVAERLVDDSGVDGLIAAHVIAEDLSVIAEPVADQRMVAKIYSASLACAGTGTGG